MTHPATKQHRLDDAEAAIAGRFDLARVPATMLRPALTRERTTVLAADTVGYSRLMEQDEEATHHRLMRIRTETYQPSIERHGGHLVKHTGDGFLARFSDPAAGKRCAVDIQRKLAAQAATEPSEQRLWLRMGLNVCEAIIDHDDIFGEGVNVAARLQAYAEPGDIVISRALADEIDLQKNGTPWVDLGELTLKNLSRPVGAINLRVGSVGRPPATAPRRDDPRPSIAILPFSYRNAPDTDQMLAAGLVDELVNTLGALRQLFVISRASTILYDPEAIDARRIGRELGVRYLLHGAVSRRGDSVVINAELSETQTGSIVTAERLEGPRADLFGLQTRLATEVLRTIAPQLQEHELRRIKRQPSESCSAYDLTLQALDHLYRMDPASHDHARGLLRQAIADDTDFAPSRTYMAYALVLRVGEGWSTDPQADSAEAARLANEAIERNRYDALALAVFGHVHSLLFKNYDAARMYLDRALEAGPNCANAWTLSSATHGYVGNGPAAIAQAEHGLRLSPYDGHVFWHESLLAQALYINGRFDEALYRGRRALAQNRNMVANLRLVIATLVAMERHAEAAGVADQLRTAQPDFRLSVYAPRCPFTGPILQTWLDRLRAAGLPA